MASFILSFQATLFDSEQQMTLHHVQQIEEHVAASNSNCAHPQLKDIVLNDPIKGSSPLLLIGMLLRGARLRGTNRRTLEG